DTGVNRTDELSFVWADAVVKDVGGTPGTDSWRDALSAEFASVIGHEAAHTFGLAHSTADAAKASADERLMIHGDVMRSEQETVVNQLFTRFALVADDAGPPRVNAYNTFKNSADIGLRDDNRNKIPDFAYVTGTGANDVIKLTDGGTDAAGRR